MQQATYIIRVTDSAMPAENKTNLLPLVLPAALGAHGNPRAGGEGRGGHREREVVALRVGEGREDHVDLGEDHQHVPYIMFHI